MSAIVLVDTSILLNVVNVPGRNQQRTEVLQALELRIRHNDHLFIPLAAIIETGNHIAHVDDGGLRRQAAQRFTKAIEDALKDIVPWKPLNFPNHADLLAWLSSFPDSAMRKVGMGDLSIQKEWEQLCQKFPMSRVAIWSADSDLQGFDRVPQQCLPQ
ncbi:MAG: hypothetical protein PHW78_03980 [Macromonas bipunctata]|nr:hypothetical protein [Macromonas bipunctata]